jgi:hypothetical protein
MTSISDIVTGIVIAWVIIKVIERLGRMRYPLDRNKFVEKWKKSP